MTNENMIQGRNEIKKQLRAFFLMTFFITWLLWLPSVLKYLGFKIPGILLFISMLASFTPSFVGIYLNKKFLSSAKFKNEYRIKLAFRFNKIWFLAIAFFYISIAGISLLLVKLMDSTFIISNPIKPIFIPLIFLQILFVGGALGEEFGWRGFALDRLEDLYQPFYATLILGFMWSLWHLPLFFMMGTVQSQIPIWQFFLQNTLIAYSYTWVYRRTKGNLILMIYIHALANTASAVLPYWQSDVGRWFGFCLLFIGVICLYVLPEKKMIFKKKRMGH